MSTDVAIMISFGLGLVLAWTLRGLADREDANKARARRRLERVKEDYR